jgi:hypothetical protein
LKGFVRLPGRSESHEAGIVKHGTESRLTVM